MFTMLVMRFRYINKNQLHLNHLSINQIDTHKITVLKRFRYILYMNMSIMRERVDKYFQALRFR